MNGKDVFIWTEAFNCVEILPPFLQSFRAHHEDLINVVVSKDEVSQVPRIKGVNVITLEDSALSKIYRNNEKSVIKGYSRGHLGTARIWSRLIQNRKERYFVHLDADTVFLGNCISALLEQLKSGVDFAGTRRPYLKRGYRTEGRDGLRLNRHPDALNTDFLGFRRDSITNIFSPFLTRWIRGKRPLRYPVVDFFDPIIFQSIRRGKQVLYIDSPADGPSSTPNLESEFFTKRISFAAVGSGLNFLKNPEVQTSEGYRAYAISSYSLYAKYLLGIDTGYKTLDNPDIESRLKILDKNDWTLDI